MRLLLALLPLLAACDRAEPPMILAAASLERVLPTVLAGTGRKAVTSYAATSTLSRQVEMGLEADLLLSADRAWVDHLEREGLVEEARELARNRLVVWGRHGEETLLGRDDLASDRLAGTRIAVGDENVPVGRYAREVLGGLGIEDRLLPCRDAREVVRTLALGEADWAVAYATDGIGIEGIRPVMVFDPGPEIRYWAVLLRDRKAARELLESLTSPRARRAFASAGFREEPPR